MPRTSSPGHNCANGLFLDEAPFNAEEESSDEDPDEDEDDHPVHAPNDEGNRDLHSDDEDHPVELDWAAQSSRDFFRAPDLLGGDGGVGALQERWFPGFVVRHRACKCYVTA